MHEFNPKVLLYTELSKLMKAMYFIAASVITSQHISTLYLYTLYNDLLAPGVMFAALRLDESDFYLSSLY